MEGITMNKQEAITRLHEILKPGDTVQTILRHVSRSGMSRSISPVVNGEDISYLVVPLGYRFDKKNGGVKIGGCGMDMGFHLVYNLSWAMFTEGFECAGEKKCHASDHSNGDRNYKPHTHKVGGYALVQRWL
jgi:hypothetical protein